MDVLKAYAQVPTTHVRHVMGFKYMFVSCFVVDAIVEAGVLVCFM